MAFIILIVFGVICALLANGKGRSPIAWFIIGFVAPILGLILVCVLPDQKESERRYDRLGQQNRLLRERLKKSQMANRRKLARVNKRLQAHDRSLDMDTGEEEAQQLEYDEDQEDVDEERYSEPGPQRPVYPRPQRSNLLRPPASPPLRRMIASQKPSPPSASAMDFAQDQAYPEEPAAPKQPFRRVPPRRTP